VPARLKKDRHFSGLCPATPCQLAPSAQIGQKAVKLLK
jgi:hypothetical protein